MALADNLVAFWKFDQSLVDAIAGLVMGTVEGLPHYAPGKIGNGWDISGTTNRVPGVLHASLNPYNISWSYSCWVQDVWTSSGLHIVYWYDGSSTSSRTIVSSIDGVISVTGGLGAAVYSAAGAFNNSGVWRHVAVSYPLGALASIYVDGVKYTGTVVRTVPNKTPTLYLGYAANTGIANCPGVVDAFGFWNRAITDADVAELYNAGSGWEPSPPFVLGSVDIAAVCSAVFHANGAIEIHMPSSFVIRRLQ